MTRGLSFSAAKEISTEMLISKHLNAVCSPPKDQRTKTDGMTLQLIPEGGLHSSLDPRVSTLYHEDTQPSQKSCFRQTVHWHHKHFITHPTHRHIYTRVSSAIPGHHLTLKSINKMCFTPE